MLGTTIARAKVKLAKAENQKGVMNHTCASLLFEAGASPAYVMSQLGHTSSALSPEVYARKLDAQPGHAHRAVNVRFDGGSPYPADDAIGWGLETGAALRQEPIERGGAWDRGVTPARAISGACSANRV